MMGLIEENVAVVWERQRMEGSVRMSAEVKMKPRDTVRTTPVRARPPEMVCWNCGRARHIKRNCTKRYMIPGNGHMPRGRQAPGQES